MKKHKIFTILIALIAGIFLMNEVSYAWIVAAAGAAARRVRKNMHDKQPAIVNNEACPVTGDKIDMKKLVTVEYNGEVYNLCCPMCIDEFNKNPEKYSRIAKKQAQ